VAGDRLANENPAGENRTRQNRADNFTQANITHVKFRSDKNHAKSHKIA